MTPEKYTQNQRNAVLGSIEHPNYVALANNLMDGVSRTDIKAVAGFSDEQIDAMEAHIVKVCSETPSVEPEVTQENKEQPNTVEPVVASNDVASDIPVQSGLGAVAQPQAPEMSQPQSDNSLNMQEDNAKTQPEDAPLSA